MSKQLAYAVARIRALEVSLFSDSIIDQLMGAKDEPQALSFLEEKGWGDSQISRDPEKMLEKEEEKIWETINELSVDKEKFSVLFYPNLFHNLKAAIKAIGQGKETWQFFYDDVELNRDEMMEIIRNKDFASLPEYMQEAAKEAYESFMHTKDGQLCDVIIDKATLDAIYKDGKNSGEAIISNYAETTVAVADIKTALRSSQTKKSLEFVKRALAKCDTVDVEALAKAAQIGVDSIKDYLKTTVYADGVEALDHSPSAFERWCDNKMIQTIQPEKYNPFGIGPIFAYVIARQNEIKTVRVILSGKRNQLPEKEIRERVRQMYV